MKVTVFCHVSHYSWAKTYQRFKRTCFIHLRGWRKIQWGSSKILVICAKHHGVTPHKTTSLVSYPVHKTPNPISLTAICIKIHIFLTYDAVSTGNARKGLLRPSGWRQQAPPKYLYLFTNRHDVISKKDFNFHKHYCALVNSHMYFNIIFPYTYISLTFTISHLGCVFIVCSIY
jgi:hypothetical protein